MNRKPVIIDHTRVADGLIFDTHRDRARYIGTWNWQKPRWLEDNADCYVRIADIQQEPAQLGPPVENEDNRDAAPAEPNCETSLHDVQKDGDDDSDGVAPGNTRPENCSPSYQPTSLPTLMEENIPNGSPQIEPLPRANAAMSQTEGPKKETNPLRATSHNPDQSGSRQPKKQKLPARILKGGRKLSPERMQIVLNSLKKIPILSHAAGQAGVHYKTLEYWIKRSTAGDDGYDIEWQGFTARFHTHCQAAIGEAHDRLVAVAYDIAMGGITYRTDQVLVDLGFQGEDAYAKDENGNFIVEAVRPGSSKMLRFLLELLRPEEWGKPRKRRKINVPQKSHVLVIGDTTQKSNDNNTAASVKARKWKSWSKRILT